MKIYCSRSRSPHLVGEITDADGLMLTYRDAVHTSPSDPNGAKSPQDGFYYRGSQKQLREPLDERLGGR